MSKIKDYNDSDSFILTQSLCAQIDNSPQSKRISKYDPKVIFDLKPFKIAAKRYKKREKSDIIPELKQAVEIIRSRLGSTFDMKSVTRPSTRMKIDTKDSISPGKYHRTTTSTGGFEFSRSPRLEENLTHKISSILYLELAIHKRQLTPGNFKEKNKTEAKNILDFQSKLREKNKDHNEKVANVMKNYKIRRLQERENKKAKMIDKIENMK